MGNTATFYARIKETATHTFGASASTGPVAFAKLDVPDAPALNYIITGDFPNKTITITPVTGAEYSFNDAPYSSTNTYTSTVAEDITIRIRLAATATHNASPVASIAINTANQNQAAPPQPVLGITPSGKTSYTVTIPLVDGAEYSFDGVVYSDASGSNIKSGCLPGESVTGYIRLKAKPSYNTGATSSATLTLPLFQADKPVASPNGGSFTGNTSVTLTAEAGASIYYTLNGSDPLANGQLYTAPLNITQTTRLRAVAIMAGMKNSAELDIRFTKTLAVLENFPAYTGSGDISARVDANRSDFLRLELNGVAVSTQHYSLSDGSTIITLKESYLKTLANGTYNFAAILAPAKLC